MCQGRDDEALKILKDGAKYNKATLPPDDQIKDLMRRIREEGETEAAADDSAEKSTKEKLYEAFKELIVLLETPEMRKRSFHCLDIYLPLLPRIYLFRTLNVFYSWLVVAMVYYGLSFNSKNLGADRYVSTFVSGFVEVFVLQHCSLGSREKM